jgi:hypothetical protein
MLQPHFNLKYVLFDVLMTGNRKYTACDAVYFPPDLRHVALLGVTSHTPPNLPFFVLFLLTTKINYGSPTILTRCGEKEEIFWNDFIHSLPVFL